MSCRFQSGVTIENSDIRALCWFYAAFEDGGEGPYPSNVKIADRVFHTGRGNPKIAIVFSGLPEQGGIAERWRAIHDLSLIGNTIFGDTVIEGAERVLLKKQPVYGAGCEDFAARNPQASPSSAAHFQVAGD